MNGFDISRSSPSPKATPDNRRPRYSGRNPVSGLWHAVGGNMIATHFQRSIDKAFKAGISQADPTGETMLMEKMLGFPEVAEILQPGSISIEGPDGKRMAISFSQLKAKLLAQP